RAGVGAARHDRLPAVHLAHPGRPSGRGVRRDGRRRRPALPRTVELVRTEEQDPADRQRDDDRSVQHPLAAARSRRRHRQLRALRRGPRRRRDARLHHEVRGRRRRPSLVHGGCVLHRRAMGRHGAPPRARRRRRLEPVPRRGARREASRLAARPAAARRLRRPDREHLPAQGRRDVGTGREVREDLERRAARVAARLAVLDLEPEGVPEAARLLDDVPGDQAMTAARLARRSVALAAACAMFGALAGGVPARAQERAPFKIGLLIPVTGVFAAPGSYMREGLELYLSQHENELGGRKVELDVGDSQGNPSVGLTQARKLVEQDHVDVLFGPLSAAVGAALIPYIDQHKVPTVYPIVSSDDLTQRTLSPYVARTEWTSSQTTHVLGDYANKKPHVRKVPTIAYDFSFGWESIGGFVDVFQSEGG